MSSFSLADVPDPGDRYSIGAYADSEIHSTTCVREQMNDGSIFLTGIADTVRRCFAVVAILSDVTAPQNGLASAKPALFACSQCRETFGDDCTACYLVQGRVECINCINGHHFCSFLLGCWSSDTGQRSASPHADSGPVDPRPKRRRRSRSTEDSEDEIRAVRRRRLNVEGPNLPISTQSDPGWCQKQEPSAEGSHQGPSFQEYPGECLLEMAIQGFWELSDQDLRSLLDDVVRSQNRVLMSIEAMKSSYGRMSKSAEVLRTVLAQRSADLGCGN